MVSTLLYKMREEMIMNVRELNKLSREFRTNSSRYLATKYGTEQQDLKRFLLFIENTPLIMDYINECIGEEIDFEEIIQQKGWNEKFNLPLESKEEVSYVYQLLKYIDKTGNFVGIIMGYGSGRKIQDHLDAFNHQVVIHLINHIREYIEDTIYGIEPLKPEFVESSHPKIFISYCWEDKLFADLIDEDFKKLGFTLTRDERDLRFKESIKSFMESIGKHDFVISIISDNYLKSVNCMYEISEVMRLREYKDKMLLIILNESDINLLPDSVLKPKNFSANIYEVVSHIEYIKFWEGEERNLAEKISMISEDVNKIQPLNELKRIQSIKSNISDFLADISDWNNTNLSELKASNYSAFIEEIQSIKNV